MAQSNKENNGDKTTSKRNPDLEALKTELHSVQERLSKLERNFDESVILQKLRVFEDQIKKMESQVSDITQKGEKAIEGLRDGFRRVWSDWKTRGATAGGAESAESTPPTQQ